jgi:hypothetical protein
MSSTKKVLLVLFGVVGTVLVASIGLFVFLRSIQPISN